MTCSFGLLMAANGPRIKDVVPPESEHRFPHGVPRGWQLLDKAS